MKNDQEMLELLRKRTPPCLLMLGGHIDAVDTTAGSATLSFKLTHDFCHSGDIVQGGFITGMVDAAMSHALIARTGAGSAVPTLEIKVSFFEPGHPGRFRAVGQVARQGRSTAFLEGTLYNEQDGIVAKATATARIVHLHKK